MARWEQGREWGGGWDRWEWEPDMVGVGPDGNLARWGGVWGWVLDRGSGQTGGWGHTGVEPRWKWGCRARQKQGPDWELGVASQEWGADGDRGGPDREGLGMEPDKSGDQIDGWGWIPYLVPHPYLPHPLIGHPTPYLAPHPR